MTNKVTVLCEMRDCIYHFLDPKEGEAYKNQCGNDEIEIGEFISSTHIPKCCTYEKYENKLAVRKGYSPGTKGDKRRKGRGSTVRGSRSTA